MTLYQKFKKLKIYHSALCALLLLAMLRVPASANSAPT